jgi:hypothetical protein
VSVLPLAVAASLPPASAAPAAENGTPLVLDEPVRQAVADQLRDYKPAAARVAVSASEDVEIQTIKIANSSQRTFHARDTGLWGVTGRGTSSLGAGASTGAGESLSLCGLVTLLSAGHGTDEGDAVERAPLDDTFPPFGLRISAAAAQHQRVSSFKTDARAICAPAPGGQFSYAVESETVLSATDGSDETRTVDGSYADTCVVADETRPAGTFDKALKGPALLVLCDRAEKSGRRLTARFVFLTEVGLYLSLGEASADVTRTTRYETVEPAK